MLFRPALILVVVFACLAGEAFGQEQATTNRATELKEAPAPDSRALAPLASGAPVKVIARKGGWTQVESGSKRGWVRAFHLRFEATVEASSSGSGVGGLTSMLGFGSRKAPETSKIATIGIRGLTPEDFKNASPDPAALRKMQSYRADKASAERFAREAKLAPVAVAYSGSNP